MNKAACHIAAGIAVCTMLHAGPGFASRPSMAECFEGSDFIANAALSRDAGMSSEAFIKLAMIQLMLNRLVPSETDAKFHYREAA